MEQKSTETEKFLAFDFESRVSLITGASRGIGAEIALLMGRSNSPVVVNYKNQKERAEALCHEIHKLGGKAIAIQADVTAPEDVEKMFRIAKETLGEVQLLVNNAGARFDALTHSMSLEKWEECIRTNLLSVFLVTREALKAMLRNNFGRIVSVSSVAGTVGSFGQSNYSAAKAGISAFMKSVAVEYGRRNIRANTVVPGIIETDMTKDLRADFRESLLEQIPMSRLGKPSEVAYPVCFLLSEGASYINGITLPVNGGGLRL